MTKKIEPTLEADFTFARDEPFRLAAGGELSPVTIRYATYGDVGPHRDVILVCHALSGSARAADWWAEMFGPGLPLDPERYGILCTNVLGSCYGSTGPTSPNPKTGRPYGPDFPMVSIGDMVRAQAELLDHLGIEKLYAVVGGSIGGMQAIDWAVRYPERVARCVAIGAAPVGAMALAMSHLQRQAIRNDPAFQGGHYPPDQQPAAGLAMARAIAMCTYKSAVLFDERYGRKPNQRSGECPWQTLHGRFDVGGYLDYQGESFVRRFDANTYLIISKAMDTFEVGEVVGGEPDALRRIRAKVALVGISSDWLFPAADVLALAERMRAAGVDVTYSELISSHGHDGFLADADQLALLARAALEERRTVEVGV